jgi:hypothetical protein
MRPTPSSENTRSGSVTPFNRNAPRLSSSKNPSTSAAVCSLTYALPGLGERLQAGRNAHHVTLRRVVHAQIVPDRADHHLAGIEAHARGERQAALALELLREATELLA